MLEPPALSTLVIARSAVGVRVSLSVAVLLARLGSKTFAGAVTVAVLDSIPVAAGLILAVTV